MLLSSSFLLFVLICLFGNESVAPTPFLRGVRACSVCFFLPIYLGGSFFLSHSFLIWFTHFCGRFSSTPPFFLVWDHTHTHRHAKRSLFCPSLFSLSIDVKGPLPRSFLCFTVHRLPLRSVSLLTPTRRKRHKIVLLKISKLNNLPPKKRSVPRAAPPRPFSFQHYVQNSNGNHTSHNHIT